MQLGLFFTANVLIELREKQVLRRLGATPLPRTTLLAFTYLADLLRQVMIGSTPTYPLALDLAVVCGWLMVCSVLAVKFFRWE
jgi:hypothetical protein